MLKILSKYERREIVKQTTLIDVINEQKYVFLITILYLSRTGFFNSFFQLDFIMKNIF